MHHFENVGLYDGLFVMQDVESKTLWNHITGQALYGPHVGRGGLIDEVDGRTVLVFVDPGTFTPAALFVDAANVTLEDGEIHLDTGGVVRPGVCSTMPAVPEWTPGAPSSSSAAGMALP